mmetsp:Transcript_4785/g.11495  ORF Transcript_4785/g.11495 Transcript_4785/m.11495 type:complete len:260 (-) Transcript_4785:85-864(-)
MTPWGESLDACPISRVASPMPSLCWSSLNMSRANRSFWKPFSCSPLRQCSTPWYMTHSAIPRLFRTASCAARLSPNLARPLSKRSLRLWRVPLLGGTYASARRHRRRARLCTSSAAASTCSPCSKWSRPRSVCPAVTSAFPRSSRHCPSSRGSRNTLLPARTSVRASTCNARCCICTATSRSPLVMEILARSMSAIASSSTTPRSPASALACAATLRAVASLPTWVYATASMRRHSPCPARSPTSFRTPIASVSWSAAV